jgi:hypothetical protein
MGAVYRAVDTRLNRSVAIKVVDEAFRERFQHEAREISSLNHPVERWIRPRTRIRRACWQAPQACCWKALLK